MSNLDQWNAMWNKTDNPGFHRPQVLHQITQLQARFLPNDKSAAIFIPLCGKTPEIKYFNDLGYTVLGLEGNEKAINLFSEEQNIPLTESVVDGFGKVFTNSDNSVQIYCGDLFQFSKTHLIKDVQIGAVVDKGSLVAVDPGMRTKYFEVIKEFVQSPNCKYLMFLIEHNMKSRPGPPHNVPYQYVCDQLANFGFQLLESSKAGNFEGFAESEQQMLVEKRDATIFRECVYLFGKSCD